MGGSVLERPSGNVPRAVQRRSSGATAARPKPGDRHTRVVGDERAVKEACNLDGRKERHEGADLRCRAQVDENAGQAAGLIVDGGLGDRGDGVVDSDARIDAADAQDADAELQLWRKAGAGAERDGARHRRLVSPEGRLAARVVGMRHLEPCVAGDVGAELGHGEVEAGVDGRFAGNVDGEAGVKNSRDAKGREREGQDRDGDTREVLRHGGGGDGDVEVPIEVARNSRRDVGLLRSGLAASPFSSQNRYFRRTPPLGPGNDTHVQRESDLPRQRAVRAADGWNLCANGLYLWRQVCQEVVLGVDKKRVLRNLARDLEVDVLRLGERVDRRTGGVDDVELVVSRERAHGLHRARLEGDHVAVGGALDDRPPRGVGRSAPPMAVDEDRVPGSDRRRETADGGAVFHLDHHGVLGAEDLDDVGDVVEVDGEVVGGEDDLDLAVLVLRVGIGGVDFLGREMEPREVDRGEDGVGDVVDDFDAVAAEAGAEDVGLRGGGGDGSCEDRGWDEGAQRQEG
ncbi:hypothetical protein BDK51DRAFT_39038 [Blyttiomyces helicus]|uniref:Uncharacterized protein n=1 Tax=Blyttiomyces helicus TaxID=388810 RepID=A0A4P9W9W9_9FUNG|nr:hypothetical protein BDK51DRAFT_39038 [Blyttiomyces helicus]|eukprot:RKO87938.1 hypothetical protein BDK51DRAFT_39038 [Blyttiomyces helicus]